MAVEIQLHCKTHPSYKGIRQPSSGCVYCSRIYRLVLDVWASRGNHGKFVYTIRYFRRLRTMRDRQNGRVNS